MNRQPNILFLLSDEHSHRCMGHVAQADGGEPVHTPALDRLAAQATLFTDAYCQMALCTPSRMCLLSGREARNCGAWHNESVLDPSLPTIPKALGAAGYKSALIGKMHFGGNLQFHGFQHRPYGDLIGNTGHQWEPIDAEDRNGIVVRTRDSGVTGIPESRLQEEVVATETVAFVREHVHANPEQPWFVCASFSRPHFPLTAPKRHIDRYWPDGVTEPFAPAGGDAFDHPMSVAMRSGFQVDRIDHEEMMRSRAAYFACVSHLDQVLGDLLLRLEHDGLLENTIIIYSTDHGEMAGEHGVWWKNGWYEACTRIPLIVSLPQQRRGELAARTESTPVALIDLFPTLCALAGVPSPDGLDGVDLSPALTQRQSPPQRPIVCDNLTQRWGEGTQFRAVRLGNYKYVAFKDAPPLFFDLLHDPQEQHNLLESATQDALETLEALKRFVSESIDFDAVDMEREAGEAALKERYPMSIPKRDGNQYLMPSGRLVDGDDMLYAPEVLAEQAADIFGDWPAA